MANFNFKTLFIALLCAAVFVQDTIGSRVHLAPDKEPKDYHFASAEREVNLENNAKRLLIGSVAPTCTYNECRGCKYKCRAEQVPVEGNDPMNSPYHYKCVCHR